MKANKVKDKERDSIDFGKSRIDPLFNRIFYPTLLSMVFASFFTVADGIFVGQGVGSNALAAINIVSPLFLVTTGIALMFGVGVSVVASIHLSQDNSKAANINITQAFVVATLLMVVVGWRSACYAYPSCGLWEAAMRCCRCARIICSPFFLAVFASSSK